MADRIAEIQQEIRALREERSNLIASRQIEKAAEDIASMQGKAWDNIPENLKDTYREVATAAREQTNRLEIVSVIARELNQRGAQP